MIGCAVLALGLTASCVEGSEDPDRPLFPNGVNWLTLFLYDSSTGAGVNDAHVEVRIGRHVVEAVREENFYTLSQIPAGTFPVFIEAPGYLRFIGNYTFSGTGQLSNPTQRTYSTAAALMFRTQTLVEDVEVTVFERENGNPIANGQVVATIDPAAGLVGIVNEVTPVLSGQLGLRPSTVVASVNNGKAVLPKENLVFGATYRLDVFGAQNAEGSFLQPLEVTNFRAGRDFPRLVVFMGPPAVSPVAVWANNEVASTQLDNLVVRFPYPMLICSDAATHTWQNLSGDTNASGVSAQPDTVPVTVALSENDSVLTLTHRVRAGTDDSLDNLVVRFLNVGLRVQGSNETCHSLHNIPLRSSGSVSRDITVRSGN